MKHRSGRAFSYTLFTLFSLILFLVYLWGKVQIDFAVRKNAELLRDCRNFQHDIDVLRADIDALKSYQRITVLAQERGMVFLAPDRIEDLSVDLSGLKPGWKPNAEGLDLAEVKPSGSPPR
ncbi:MAG TPA: hypothetical protein VGB38_01065, partial [bacterium]